MICIFSEDDEMTYKEIIIINDVDVSGCKHINCCCYENGKCLWTKRYYENNIVPDCEKVKNCYYKQMKRLEFENAELKEENDRYSLYIKKERDNNYNYRKALEEIRGISDNYNLTVCKRREQIANKINEVLKDE